MNRAALIAAFRSDVADEDTPFLWSDDDAQRYLDDAINEACDRARLIRDTTTAEICQVAITVGMTTFPLDGRILHVERAKLDLMSVPLEITSTPALDSLGSGSWPRGWRARSSFGVWSSFGSWEKSTGRPACIAIDRAGAAWTGRLVPTPTQADTLRLEVYRAPLDSLTEENDEPEGIEPRLHIRLLDWMKHLAYSKQDTETRDRMKAEDYAALFTSAFGPRIDASMRRMQESNHPRVVEFREF